MNPSSKRRGRYSRVFADLSVIGSRGACSDVFASKPAPTVGMRSNVGAGLLAKNDNAVYRPGTRHKYQEATVR